MFIYFDILYTIHMNIFFIRHGESIDALNRVVQREDTSLSEKGIKQVEECVKDLKDINFEYIASSPYRRAIQTSEIVLNELGIKYKPILLDILKEARRPSEIIGRSKEDEYVKDILNDIESNHTDPNWKYSDEESFIDIKNRVLELREYLIGLDKDNVLLFSHGHLIRMFYLLIKEGETLDPYTYWYRFKEIPNGGVFECEYIDGKWVLKENN